MNLDEGVLNQLQAIISGEWLGYADMNSNSNSVLQGKGWQEQKGTLKHISLIGCSVGFN